MASNVESNAPSRSESGTPQNQSTPSVTTDPSFKFYRPPHTPAGSPRELPDSYFTPTPNDLKAAQASLSARTQALMNAPLRTQAMREAEEKMKRAKWPNTTIRVKFSDRSQLEKTFPSTDKIRSVYAFVRGSLREDVKPVKFVLYQSPPKREFKVSDPNVRDLSLIDLQLSPSSVLLLKFENDALNQSDIPAPLDPAVLAAAEELPIPPDYEADSSSTPSASSTSPPPPSTSNTTSSAKVPKWLKLGHKK